MEKLFHYVHCPFCVRVRLAAGYYGQAYQSVVLEYSDESTPTQMIGKKMLPIWQKDDASFMNESLDIIVYLDLKHNKKLKVQDYLSSPAFNELDLLLNQMGKALHSLVMPHWIFTAEFDPKNREYFQKKKEATRGSFKDLVANRAKLEQELHPFLQQIENEFSSFYKSKDFSLADILLASHLWGLYMLPEFQFSPKMHKYLQEVKSLCAFDYHKDFWL